VEHAEEAFSAVMRMDPKSDKANEIYFRLGIIYKGQQKYSQSLEVSFLFPPLAMTGNFFMFLLVSLLFTI